MKLRYVVSVASVLGAVLSFNIPHAAKANVADDLNANYNNIVENCGGADKPAYLCSGNIVRLTAPASTKYHVWDPGSNSVNNTKIISTTYLRKDINVHLHYNLLNSGIIYYPEMLKPLSKKDVEITCAFPMDGWTSARSNGGCGRPNDHKTCQDLGIYTGAGWYVDLISRTSQGAFRFAYQCGFDMSAQTNNRAEYFNQVLAESLNIYDDYSIYEGNDNSNFFPNEYNELTLSIWHNTQNGSNYEFMNPENLPIQAFFYTQENGNNGLENARFYQKDYYKKTGIIIPIVQLNNDDHSKVSFSYHAEDRGVTVADELNVNYNKIVDNCGDKDSPAYQCSGIVFRQTSYNSNYHVWDPSALSIQYGGVSFAYMRKDIQFTTLMNPSRHSGFIYYPSQQRSDKTKPVQASCIFPATGWSNDRHYGRCGQASTFPKNSVECQQQGVYTSDDWYKHLMSFGLNGMNVFQNQCGFDVSVSGYNTADAFLQSIKAHNLVATNNNGGGTNELIIRTQRTDTNGNSIHPEELPLQAFYYQDATGLTEAQHYQQDYYNVTGKIVPVVYMNTTDFNNISFEYKTTDQVDLKKNSNVAAELTANYNKVVDNCGSEASPAFVCSGNIIRFTNYSTKYRVWDPSPPAVERKGISFMYIRQDLPLDKAFKDKGSGLIYYPTKMMPASKEFSSIRCAFPVDGYSDRRYTDGQNDACGANINYPNNSQPCQEQGITTGHGWYIHFSSIPDVDKNRLNHQCGFSLANTEQNQASIFKAKLDGQKLLQAARGSASYNELVLTIPAYNTVTDANGNASYQIDNPAALPIEAFFYTNDSGLTEARGYQQDYHDYAHVDAPIVKLDLDTTTGAVTYSYNKTDQTDAYNTDAYNQAN